VKLDLDRVVLCVATETLAPIVTDGVSENVAVLAEACCDNAAADLGVALEAVLGVLVPKVESSVGTCSGEGLLSGPWRCRGWRGLVGDGT
jgi:hypothetical protein